MKPEIYTVLLASNCRGTMRRFTVPSYALHSLTTFVIIGGISLIAAVGSYAHLLWKVAGYNALARKQSRLEQQYQELETAADNAGLRLSSLQSLAAEVAMSYRSAHPQTVLFDTTRFLSGPDVAFEDSVMEFSFLEKNAMRIGLDNSGAGTASFVRSGLSDSFTPTLWPVVGQITSYFGDRLDPFSGEDEFHTGVDISTPYGEIVRATGDGVVIQANVHAGYGRLLVIDHGLGVTTYYGHLASFVVSPGMHLKRGDAIGHVGVSGRTTGPHLHYEVRLHDKPVDPMRYLQHAAAAD